APGDGRWAESSPGRDRADARQARAARLRRLRERGDPSSVGDAAASLAQLARRRGLSWSAGLPRRPRRGAITPPAGRFARPDPPAKRKRASRGGAVLRVPTRQRKDRARPDREPLWRFIGVTATPGDELVFLSVVGEV